MKYDKAIENRMWLEYHKHQGTYRVDFNEQELDRWDAIANYLWLRVIKYIGE